MNDVGKKIYSFIESVEAELKKQLKHRIDNTKPDFADPEVYTVVTALLARQATLFLEILSSPNMWNNHTTPMFLRAIADVHITLNWILVNPTERARKYIAHGLGQAVLMMEHRKSKVDQLDDEVRKQVEEAIKADEAWIDIQKWHFLVDVNIGSWSGKSTREMADEGGILDFYNNVYTPFSQCGHSTWWHVGRYNSEPSDNPMNSLVWKAIIRERKMDIWNFHLTAKYLDKTFDLYDEKVLRKDPESNIHDWIYDQIQDHFVEKED